MSDDATVRFGYDGKALDAGLSAQERRMVQSAGRMEKSIKSVGGGGALRSMGNVSMQIQDIAVQMQSGTRASIIFAQQGSQMLSAFGPAGAVAGAVAAIGGAMYLAKEKAEETFKSAIKSAEAFRKENARMVRESRLDNLAEGFKRVRDELEKLDEAEKAFNANVPFYTSNKKRDEGRAAIDEQRTKVSATSGQLLRQALDVSEREVQLSNMVLAGQEEEAAALVRKIELEKKIVAINELNIIESSKQKLISDATLRAANQESLIKRETATRDREKRQQAQHELETKRQSIKLARDEVDIMELTLQGRTDEADILKENSFITKRAHEHSASGLDAGASIALAAREWAVLIAQQRRAEADKAKAQKAEMADKRETLSMERKSVDLLEAEAKGQNSKVKKLKEEAYITQRMKQLSGLGIGADEAESIARRELKARKEKEKYDETGRAHIGGVKMKRSMGDQFHGLDQFERNQEKQYEPDGPTRPGYRKGQPVPRFDAFDAFGSGWGPPTTAQLKGRYMGGDKAGTRTFISSDTYKNARAQNTEANGGIAGKIDKSNDHLSTIAAALA